MTTSNGASYQQHPQEIMRKLLGARMTCRLSDGRELSGTFVCVDRLKNIILADCVETRCIDAADYGRPAHAAVVTRALQQAMVPGDHLVSVRMERRSYDERMERKPTEILE